jgi:hypothetical protein
MSIITSVLNLADVPGYQTIPCQIHFKSIQTTSNIFGLLRESILLVFSNKGTKAFPRKDACLHCKWLVTISWNAPGRCVLLLLLSLDMIAIVSLCSYAFDCMSSLQTIKR